MSAEEIDRLDVVQRVRDGRLTQVKAAERLGLTTRQMRRLCLAFAERGAAGLVSRRRGKRSNRRLARALEEEALALVAARYSDFGPTLAREKLVELHGVRVAKETLRKWMIAAGLWVQRAQRPPKAHQPRHRRECFGDLVQIDGCEHAWFEDRGATCTVLVYVDDATGRLMELRFVGVESAFDYFDATASYLRRHGRPVAFYSDKHSVFSIKSLAKGALALLNTANFPRISNTELDLNLLDIEAMSHLGLYGGNKIKAAYNLEKGLPSDPDADAAYCTWKIYTGQMADMYTPANLQRNIQTFSSWSMYDSNVLSDAGGSADCVTNYPVVTINSPADNGTIRTTNGTLTITAVAGSRVDVKHDGLAVTSQIATGIAQTFVIPTIPVGAGHVIQVRVYETDGDFTSKTITVTGSDTATSCADGVQNNGETQVDCGGSNCGACVGTCTDGILNNGETAKDCGGPNCAACTAPPSCTDGILNNSETQIDCGGPNCNACGTSNTLINASFASDAEGFAYADNVFRSANLPNFASGAYATGKLNVTVGGGNTGNASGGWSKGFTTASAGAVNVTLKYSMTTDPGIDPGEWIDTLVSIDGILYGASPNDYVRRIEDGGNQVETTFSFTSASLAAGSHTITLGANMNASSAATETGTMTFDDVIVTTAGAPPPPPSGTTYINATFASSSDGFTYADNSWATSSDVNKAGGAYSAGKINVSVGGSGIAGTSTNLNGGWSKTFTTTAAGALTVTFKYSMTTDLGIDPGEWVETRVMIDGTSYGQTGPLGTGINVFQIEAGGDKVETTYTFTTGSLAAGSHTLTLGAFMNSESATTETGTVTFDDVTVTGP